MLYNQSCCFDIKEGKDWSLIATKPAIVSPSWPWHQVSLGLDMSQQPSMAAAGDLEQIARQTLAAKLGIDHDDSAQYVAKHEQLNWLPRQGCIPVVRVGDHAIPIEDSTDMLLRPITI